jgi:protein tyrosine/serine phosphatase
MAYTRFNLRLGHLVSVAIVAAGFQTACSETGRAVESIEGFRTVAQGEVYAGARPDPVGLRWLDSLGVKTILSLERGVWRETSGEVDREWKAARKLGLRFVHLPLHPTDAPTMRELDWAVAILEDPWTHPIFVHGDQGSDRTGMVIAAYRIKVQGWSPGRAYREMTEHGFRQIIHFGWKDRLFSYAEVVRGSTVWRDRDP